MSEDACTTCAYEMESESEDLETFCKSSDYKESESSDLSYSDGAGESSSSSDESSSRIGNTHVSIRWLFDKGS